MRLTTRQADTICDTSFTSAFAWNRNGKGNLWRKWRGRLLTIYQRGPLWYWSVREHRTVNYGNRAHTSEEQAMNELRAVLIGAK